MATDGGQQRELRNDTAVNVVGLLKGQTGATRSYHLLLDTFEADGETIARDIDGDVRLTRLRDAVIARVSAAGVASMICARASLIKRLYPAPYPYLCGSRAAVPSLSESLAGSRPRTAASSGWRFR